LKAARFPPEGKQDRVAKALRTLASLRFGIPVDGIFWLNVYKPTDVP
jgi:hypothetical protein